MNHRAWSALTKGQVYDPRMWEVLLAHTQGYILALEDVLKDLEDLQPGPLPGYATGTDEAFRLGHQWVLSEAYDHVSKALDSATCTLEAMDRMINEKPNTPGTRTDQDQAGPEDQGRVPE